MSPISWIPKTFTPSTRLSTSTEATKKAVPCTLRGAAFPVVFCVLLGHGVQGVEQALAVHELLELAGFRHAAVVKNQNAVVPAEERLI